VYERVLLLSSEPEKVVCAAVAVYTYSFHTASWLSVDEPISTIDSVPDTFFLRKSLPS
jgi:hypothetical protein